MLGLSALDWMILFVILMNVLGAIGQGFFYELFSFAGVILGYLIAAWQYPRVAAFYIHYVNSEWVADIAGFMTLFVLLVVLGGVSRKDRPVGGPRSGTALVRSFAGRAVRVSEGHCDLHRRGNRTGGLQSDEPVDSGFADSAVHAGDRTHVDMGGAAGITAALSRWLEPDADGPRAHSAHWRR